MLSTYVTVQILNVTPETLVLEVWASVMVLLGGSRDFRRLKKSFRYWKELDHWACICEDIGIRPFPVPLLAPWLP